MTVATHFKLNNGSSIPAVGLGQFLKSSPNKIETRKLIGVQGHGRQSLARLGELWNTLWGVATDIWIAP